MALVFMPKGDRMLLSASMIMGKKWGESKKSLRTGMDAVYKAVR